MALSIQSIETLPEEQIHPRLNTTSPVPYHDNNHTDNNQHDQVHMHDHYPAVNGLTTPSPTTRNHIILRKRSSLDLRDDFKRAAESAESPIQHLVVLGPPPHGIHPAPIVRSDITAVRLWA